MSISKRISWVTIGTTIIALVALTSMLVWISGQTNNIAADETRLRASHAVATLVRSNAVLVEDYAHWEAAYHWYQADDTDALYESLGSGAAESESFDLLYFADSAGTVTHAYGSEVYESDLGLVEPEIITAVQPLFKDHPMLPYDVISGPVLVGDEIAIVATGRLQPDDIDGLLPSDLPILIGVKWLDPPEMGAEMLLSGMEYKPAVPDRQTLASIPLTDIAGQPIGMLTWTPPRPGSALLRLVTPVLVSVAFLLLVGNWFVGRAVARQARDYLSEHQSARTDPMTGVLNRSGLAEISERPNVRAALSQGQAALLYVDMNGLKSVNDTYGHGAGDNAISVTAKRLRSAVRAADYVARMGGDEFVCLILSEDPAAAADTVAQRFAQKSERPFRHGDYAIMTGASIGIALAASGSGWDTLITHADEAMYEAKRSRSQSPVTFGGSVRFAG